VNKFWSIQLCNKDHEIGEPGCLATTPVTPLARPRKCRLARRRRIISRGTQCTVDVKTRNASHRKQRFAAKRTAGFARARFHSQLEQITEQAMLQEMIDRMATCVSHSEPGQSRSCLTQRLSTSLLSGQDTNNNFANLPEYRRPEIPAIYCAAWAYLPRRFRAANERASR
jgi:hypothetical protein